MKRILYYIFLFFCFCISYENLNASATIVGTITDSTTGLPISGALVELFKGNQVQYSTFTIADGTYSISNIQPSNYTLIVSAAGYQTQSVGIKLDNNQTTTVNLALVSNGGTITGTVTNAATTTPISGATVQIFQGSTLITTTTTDGSGIYSVPNLAPGNYNVLAKVTNFQGQIKGAIVQASAMTTVDFALQLSPGTISGTVRDARTTNPLSGAFVQVFNGSIIVGFSNTDINGNYTIANLEPGNYVVIASATGYQTKAVGAIVRSNTITTVNFDLTPNPGSIVGKIINASTGNAISAAKISVIQHFTLISSTLTDVNGNYSINGLAPGNYIVVANASNFRISVVGATVTSNKITIANFALIPNPGRISGTVIDAATTSPISGATIQVFDDVILIATVLTDSNGNYTIANLAPGNYNVTVNKNNYQMQVVGAAVQSNITTIVNFALVVNSGTISGTIIDAQTSNPIAGAEAFVFLGQTFMGVGITDINGKYIVSNLAPGDYIVVAIAQGFQAKFSTKIVFSNSVAIANFALNNLPGMVSGVITEACTRNPVESALVLVTDGRVIINFGLSDNHGNYSISNLSPGNYIVTVIKRNFLINNAKAMISSNINTILNFVIIPTTLSSNVDSLTKAIREKY